MEHRVRVRGRMAKGEHVVMKEFSKADICMRG